MGDDVLLGVDTNWAYDADDALALGNAMCDQGYWFFEEPLPPGDHAGYRRLAQHLPIRLAAGESDFTSADSAELVREHVLGLIQPDVARSGGITETWRVAEHAALHGVSYAPHVGWSGGICSAASVHLAAAAESFLTFECMVFDNPLRQALTVPVSGDVGALARRRHTDGAGCTRPRRCLGARCPRTLQDSRMTPELSRFDPLKRILAFDEFDRGFCGWAQHQGNYEGSLDSVLPGYAQMQPPMLSTLPNWDFGSHGGVDGGYVMKIQTLPQAGARSSAVKRMTFRDACPIRLEFYFTFKPEASDLALSESDVRAFGLLFDLQSGDRTPNGERVMPHLRFLNARDGEHVQKWQFKRAVEHAATLSNKTATHDHMADSGLGGPPRRRPEALLQRDRDQGELALRADRHRPGHAPRYRLPHQ